MYYLYGYAWFEWEAVWNGLNFVYKYKSGTDIQNYTE